MVFEITQNDTSPTLLATLTDGTEVIDLTNATEVEFHMENEFEEVVINEDTTGNVNIVDDSAGEVEYIFTASDTSNIGTYYAEWQVTFSSGAVETFPTEEKTRVDVVSEIA